MSHKFTTPRVVYLGQAYRGQDDRTPRSQPRLPQTSSRGGADRLDARRIDAAARTGAR
jgi:hypothetical protein